MVLDLECVKIISAISKTVVQMLLSDVISSDSRCTNSVLTEQHRGHLLEVGADLFVRPEFGGVVHQTRHSRELGERCKLL